MGIRNESGVALILVLGLLVVIGVVALVVSVISITERGLTANERMQRLAFDTAEFGLERYISRLDRVVVKQDTTFDSGNVPGVSGSVYWWGVPSDTGPKSKNFAGAGAFSSVGFPGYSYELLGDTWFRVEVVGSVKRPNQIRDVRRGIDAAVAVGPKIRVEVMQ